MTQKPKLSVGDYVHAYTDRGFSHEGTDYAPGGFGGTVDCISPSGDWVTVSLSGVPGMKRNFHRKQCRKLRPKQKPEKERKREEAFSVEEGPGHTILRWSRVGHESKPFRRLLEVRPGEVVLGRGELARAWDKIAPSLGAWNRGSFFETMAESLGLGKK